MAAFPLCHSQTNTRCAAPGLQSCKKAPVGCGCWRPPVPHPSSGGCWFLHLIPGQKRAFPPSLIAWGVFAWQVGFVWEGSPEILPLKYHTFLWCCSSSCSAPAQKGSKEWVKCLPHRPSHPSSLPCKRHCLICCNENHSGLQANSGKTHSRD